MTSGQEEYVLEEGRRLASERDDLIASGVDPSELLVPRAPAAATHDGEHAEPCAGASDRTAPLRPLDLLFSGGPDTPCRTTWPEGVECVEAPMADLRAAFDQAYAIARGDDA